MSLTLLSCKGSIPVRHGAEKKLRRRSLGSTARMQWRLGLGRVNGNTTHQHIHDDGDNLEIKQFIQVMLHIMKEAGHFCRLIHSVSPTLSIDDDDISSCQDDGSTLNH
jgi:hypothetical protein